MPSVLFVCTANRFRSPLAAMAFSRRMKGESDFAEWEVGSAGTWTQPDFPALALTEKIARRLDLDLSRHVSRPITAELLLGYDLILVMESGHKEAIQNEFPASRNRIFLLSEVVHGLPYDILDPLGSGEEAFQEVADEIIKIITEGSDRICQLARRLYAARIENVHEQRM